MEGVDTEAGNEAGNGADDRALIAHAEAAAASLVRRADRLRTRAEREHLEQVGAFIADPDSREFMLRLTDEVLRTEDPRTAGRRLAHLVHRAGTPAHLGPFDRTQLRSAAIAARVTPVPVVNRMRSRLRHELAPLVLDADPRTLGREIARLRAAGFVVMVNPVGEDVLSDADAQRRLARAEALVVRPDVDRVTIKASALVANLDVLDHDGSVERVAAAFGQLCRAAVRPVSSCFVALDMEEYRDLWPTLRGFLRALEDPQLHRFQAGIALQAYLPESAAAFEELASWASARVERGGAPVQVRLVKGANLALERADAERHGWNPAPLPSKAEVDANFIRMLDRILRPELAGVIRPAIGSHNLFDIGWALTLAQHTGTQIDVEMLHGMADGEARAVAERIRSAGLGSAVMYTPVVEPGDWNAAAAYLLRRFDENVSAENFLAHLPGLRIGSDAWQREAGRFRASVARRYDAEPVSRRAAPPAPGPGPVPAGDFAQVTVREGIAKALAAHVAPRPPDQQDADRALACARAAGPRWAATPATERARLLEAVATRVLADRYRTIAALALGPGVPLRPADREVSAVADLARYDAHRARDLPPGFTPFGVTVVAGRWDQPYAGPAAGVLAALAAGATVVLATRDAAVAVLLVEQCRAAGVPDDVLQLVPGDAGIAVRPGVDAVVLSASAADVARVRVQVPGRPVLATDPLPGSVVVSAAADLDDAIRGTVASAFTGTARSAGVLVAETSVLDETRFTERLIEAARSVRTGPAFEPSSRRGPLPHPVAAGAGAAGDWLLTPERQDDDRLWTPGIRSVERELAGGWSVGAVPALEVVRARDVAEAVEIQNGLSGTCAGLFSLDDEEIEDWLDASTKSDLVVNRPLPGARAGRRPTGGPGPQTGGPLQVRALGRGPGEGAADADAVAALWRQRAAGDDTGALVSEENRYRLRALRRGVLLRPGGGVDPVTVAALAAVAERIRVPVTISDPDDASDGEFVELALGGTFDRVRLIGSHPDRLVTGLLAAGLDVDLRAPGPDPLEELLAWTREQTVTRTLHRHGHVRRVVRPDVPPD